MSEIRISAGIARGRSITVPPGASVRPLRNLVRQAIFNIIGPCIEDASVLDLFAGCGSFGIEALSRGARLAVFVENSPENASYLRKNLEKTAFAHCASIHVSDASDYLRNEAGSCNAGRFRVVFADPPYSLSNTPAFLSFAKAIQDFTTCLEPGSLIVLHVEADRALPDLTRYLPGKVELRKYGRNLICVCRQEK